MGSSQVDNHHTQVTFGEDYHEVIGVLRISFLTFSIRWCEDSLAMLEIVRIKAKVGEVG